MSDQKEKNIESVNVPVIPTTPAVEGDAPIVIPEDLIQKEVDKRLKAVQADISKKEKNKLYEDLTTVKTKNNDLAAKLKSYEEKEELEAKARKEQEDADALAKLTAEEKIQHVVKMNQQALDESNRRYEELKTQFTTEMQSFQESTNKKLTAKELALYRERQITAAGGAIIPGLVADPNINLDLTQEQIDASIEASKKEYNRVKEDIYKTSQSTSQSTIVTTEEIPFQSLPSSTTPSHTQNYNNVSREDLGKAKDALYSQLNIK